MPTGIKIGSLALVKQVTAHEATASARYEDEERKDLSRRRLPIHNKFSVQPMFVDMFLISHSHCKIMGVCRDMG